MKLTDSIFEEKYKEFLTVREQWQVLVRSTSIFNGKTSDGIPVRHVGMTTSKSIVRQAHQLLLKWNQFAEMADDKRNAGIYVCNPAIYSPIPVIVDNFTSFSINEFQATSVNKLRKEDIISKLEKRIAKAKRNKSGLSNPYNVPELESDLIKFSHFPAGTMFRLRIGGYEDVFIDFFRESVSEGERFRVGQYGILLDSTRAEKEHKGKSGSFWAVNTGEKIKYESVYARLNPIRCSIYSNCEIYLYDDVEREKELAKKENRMLARRRYRERVKAGLVGTKPANKDEDGDAA